MSDLDTDAATGQETVGQANTATESADSFRDEGQHAPAASEASAPPAESVEARPGDPFDVILPSALDELNAPEAAPDKTGSGENAPPIKLAFPDGFQLDKKIEDEFQAIAREAKLPKKQAQKLADIYVAGQKKQMDLFRSEHARLTKRIDSQWRNEIAEDPEVGGARYEASRSHVVAAIRRFVPEEEQAAFLDFYRSANLHNNPLMFRLLARVGRQTGEAAPVRSRPDATAGEKSRADILHADLPSGRV